MKPSENKPSAPSQPRSATKRSSLKWLASLGFGSLGLAGLGLRSDTAQAHHTPTHFEDDSSHHIVYQCNQKEPEYLNHVLFSSGELLRKYGDDIEIIVACYGPGLRLLGKHEQANIPKQLQQRAASLAEYGVAFHACGNTMKALQWEKKDLLDFAKIVPIGVDDIMLLQERGFAYLAW